jgi:hypothetical protein
MAVTSTGSVSFPNSLDGKAYQAIFMSTADLPESVMDCFVRAGIGNASSTFATVSRILPGSPDLEPHVTILDGDESILTGAVDEINNALVDRQGVRLGQLSWIPAGSHMWSGGVAAGFAAVPSEWNEDSWGYVLVNPMDSRETQAMSALGGFFLNWAAMWGQPCDQSTTTYLADSGMNGRLSRQGASVLRFAASYSR